MCAYAHVEVAPILDYVSQCPGLSGALQRPSHRGTCNGRKLVSKKELKTVYGIPYCPAHIARLEAAGKFPKRLRLGACRVAWYADEIEEWIDSRPR
jgi:prophage regulatory protein